MTAAPGNGAWHSSAGDPFDRVIAAVRARGGQVRFSSSDQARATCPSHPDVKPSLSIKRCESGVLLHCHAGCPKGAPARALGFHPRDLFTGASAARVQAQMVARTCTPIQRASRSRAKSVQRASGSGGSILIPPLVAAGARTSPTIIGRVSIDGPN